MAKRLRDVLVRDAAKIKRAVHELSRSERSLLRLVDGVRTVATVVALSPLPPDDTLDVLTRLSRQGLLRRAESTQAAPPAHLEGEPDASRLDDPVPAEPASSDTLAGSRRR